MIGQVGSNGVHTSSITKQEKKPRNSNLHAQYVRDKIGRIPANLMLSSRFADYNRPILPYVPVPNPIPLTAKQKSFNRYFNIFFKNLLCLFHENREKWISQAKLSPTQSLKVKFEKHVLPWTVLIGPTGHIVVHFHERIIENVIYRGAFKIDKRAFLLEGALGFHLAKLCLRLDDAAKRTMADNELKYLQQYKGMPNITELVFVRNSYKKFIPKRTFYFKYCSNGTLINHIKTLTLHQRRQIIVDLLNGLRILHDGYNKKPTVHNDLKDENIFLDEFRGIIGDLGLACDEGNSVPFKGSIHYASPEKLKHCHYYNGYKEGEMVADISQDIWAAGCIIYELLTSFEPPWIQSLKDSFIPERHFSYEDVKDLSIAEWLKHSFSLEEMNTPSPIRVLDNDLKVVVSDYVDNVLPICSTLFPKPAEGSPMHVCWEMLQYDPKDRLTAVDALRKFIRAFS